MWIPAENQLISDHKTALIAKDYEELLYHDYPILFVGKNSQNATIVGSFVEHLNDVDVYLYSVVDDMIYCQFENQTISYREMLKKARNIYNVRFDDDQKAKVYAVSFSDIPDDYLPSPTAKFPGVVSTMD